MNTPAPIAGPGWRRGVLPYMPYLAVEVVMWSFLGGIGPRMSRLAMRSPMCVSQIRAVQPRQPIPAKDRQRVAYRQSYKCNGCGTLLPPSHHIDHIMPVALGGTNALDNLQALCVACHTRKTRRDRQGMRAAAREGTVDDGGGEHDGGLTRGRSMPDEEVPSAKVPVGEENLATALAELNGQQLLAVQAPERYVRVVAGPGTGKTRVLITRIADLIENRRVPPWAILGITFTNRAAWEMKHRLHGMLRPGDADEVHCKTFHSWCLSLLRIHVGELELVDLAQDLEPYRAGFVVYDQKASEKVIKEAVEEAGFDVDAKEVQRNISHIKNVLALNTSEMSPAIVETLAIYSRLMRQRQAMDYDDLLCHALRLLRNGGSALRRATRNIQHLLVDEYQDTNTVQAAIVSMVAEGNPRASVFAVGDGDQAIYGFRGADHANLKRFDDEFLQGPEGALYKLEVNYRSTPSIVAAAMRVIRHVKYRDNLSVVAASAASDDRAAAPTVVEYENDRDEARGVARSVSMLRSSAATKGESIGVLFRTNLQALPVKAELLRAGHQVSPPVEGAGGGPCDPTAPCRPRV